MTRPAASTHRCRQSGFTLLEILLALSLTAVIGVTVAIMLGAMSSATRVENDARRSTIRRQVTFTRLGNVIRESVMVLAAGSDHLVLWRSDANDNDVPDLSELIRLDFDDGTSELLMYAAPASLDPMSDISYSLADNFDAITTALAGSAEFPGILLLGNVTAWDVVLDDADPQQARLLRVQATLDQPSGAENVSLVVGLRAYPD